VQNNSLGLCRQAEAQDWNCPFSVLQVSVEMFSHSCWVSSQVPWLFVQSEARDGGAEEWRFSSLGGVVGLVCSVSDGSSLSACGGLEPFVSPFLRGIVSSGEDISSSMMSLMLMLMVSSRRPWKVSLAVAWMISLPGLSGVILMLTLFSVAFWVLFSMLADPCSIFISTSSE